MMVERASVIEQDSEINPVKFWRYEILNRSGRILVIFYRDETNRLGDMVQRNNVSRGAITFDNAQEFAEWETLTKQMQES